MLDSSRRHYRANGYYSGSAEIAGAKLFYDFDYVGLVPTTDAYDSYADADMDMAEYSYARGRGSNARRDSMGRYSSARGRGYSRRGYSYDDGEKEEKISMLREMMNDVSSDDERRALKQIIKRYEQE